MSPKEKAKELVEKFLPEVRGADRYNYNLESMNVFIAKECAVICADEMIELAQNLYDDTTLEEYCDHQSLEEYIKEVKREIQAL